MNLGGQSEYDSQSDAGGADASASEDSSYISSPSKQKEFNLFKLSSKINAVKQEVQNEQQETSSFNSSTVYHT